MRRRVGYVLFVILGGLGSALMVNAPSLVVGYGLVYAVMLFAVWKWEPRTAALLVFGAQVVALPFFLIPKSTFLLVAVANLVLRPALTYGAGLANRRFGRYAGAITLSLFETLVALAVDIFIFAATEAAFAIFAITLAPFVYVIVASAEKDGAARVTGVVAGSAALLAFYFSFYAYDALPTAGLGVAALVLLLVGMRRATVALAGTALAVALAGFVVGGTPLRRNLVAATYPLNPHSWTAARWEQTDPACPATSDVFAATWSPARLRIVDTCTTVTGTVGEHIAAEEDGDYTFNLDLAPADEGLLSFGSKMLEQGELHVEVVPDDQHAELDPLGGGVCPGDVVRVTGVLVLDTDHGMGAELHPAITLDVVSHASAAGWPVCVLGRQIEPPA